MKIGESPIDNDGLFSCLHSELTKSLTGHTETVRSLKFAEAKTAVSASRDAQLKIWDVETGVCQATLSGHGDAIVDLAIANQYAISGSLDSTARVWSITERRHLLTLSGHTGGVYRVDCDGGRVFTGSLDHDVRVWDLTTGNTLAVLRGHTSLVAHMAVHGDVLVTAGSDSRIIIWSLQDYAALHTISEAHQSGITSISARDGHVLSGGSDGTVKLWDLNTGQSLGDIGTQTQAVWSVSLGAAAAETVIVASAQGPSPFPNFDDAFLDVSPKFTLCFSGMLTCRQIWPLS